MRSELDGASREHGVGNDNPLELRSPNAAVRPRRAYWALSLVILGGCLPPRAEYQSKCGMYTNEEVGLSEAEARLVSVFKPYSPDVCDRVHNWYLRVNPNSDGERFTCPYHDFTKSGLTFCEYSTLDVANWDFHKNAYAHEVIHLLDCGRREPNYTHEGWEDWQYHAIGEAHKY